MKRILSSPFFLVAALAFLLPFFSVQCAGGGELGDLGIPTGQADLEQDAKKREALYSEIQKIYMDDLANYYMITLKNFTAFDKKVKDIVPLKGGDILRQNNLQVIDWWLEA